MSSQHDQHLRYFGVSLASAMLVFAVIAWRSLQQPVWGAVLAGGAAVIALVYYALPAIQPKLYAGFQAVTFPIRFLAMLLTLGIVYYCVLTPIAFWYRASGRSIRQSDDAASHWQRCPDDPSPDSYFRTF